MKRFKIYRLACLLVCLSLLCSCAATADSVQGTHNIALIVKSTDTEFWKSVFAGANAAGTEYNITLHISGPDNEEDYPTQNEMIREAVADGAEAIVFSAISYEDNADAINEAAQAGVKIVVIDSDVDSPYVGARIGTDNVDAGRKAAQALLDCDAPELVIGIVNFDVSTRNGQEREQGFRELADKDGRVSAIYTINVPTTAQTARERTTALLLQHPEINAVVAFNEPTCVGAAQAVAALDLGSRVRMVGFDTNVTAIDLMQSGDVSALIVQNPYAMGYLGVETAYGLLTGEKYDADALIDTSTTIVTQDNMFEIENQKAMFSFG